MQKAILDQVKSNATDIRLLAHPMFADGADDAATA
jgi:hypothetical protein